MPFVAKNSFLASNHNVRLAAFKAVACRAGSILLLTVEPNVSPVATFDAELLELFVDADLLCGL